MKQLRIACLGDYRNYYSYFLYGVMEGAIRNGAWFRPVDLMGQSLIDIENQIAWFKPHLLFCHCIFNTKPHDREAVFAMLKRRKNAGTKILYHSGDARTTPRYEQDISEFVSGALVNHKLNDVFSGVWKVPNIRWPYPCLYQKEIAESDQKFECFSAFTGALSIEKDSVHYDRTMFVNKLGERLNVKIFPTPETGNTRFQTAELAASAKSIIGVQMADHIPGYIDVRPFQYIGAGALYFHDSDSPINEYFEHSKHFVGYAKLSVEAFMQQYKYFVMDHPERGDKIRSAGFELCQKHHSTKERVAEAIEFARKL